MVGGWWRWSTKITITCRLERVRRRRGEKKESVTEKRAKSVCCVNQRTHAVECVEFNFYIFIKRGEREQVEEKERNFEKEENRN